MPKTVYFTICSKNYLAYALTLGRSLCEADPSAVFKIILADTELSRDLSREIEFEVIPVGDIGLSNLEDLALRYSIVEFNTAIKPACFQYLFDQRACESAIYLDPDILVLRPLVHVERALEEGEDLVLTPHSLNPLDDGEDPDDLRLLRTGVYNLGFVAFRRSSDTTRFLAWWNARLATDCRIALDDGIFVDQKWMDLAPCYVAATRLLRHPGYNAAYWNLHGRRIVRMNDGWEAGGEPLHFYHFSGVRPGDGTVFSKHQTRFTVDEIGDLSDLLHSYLQRLEGNGHADWSGEAYGYALPEEFAALDAFVRGVFQRVHPATTNTADFTQAELGRICSAPSSEISGTTGGLITNLTFEIWAQRTDLRRAFDISRSDGRGQFNAWLLTSGVAEYNIPAQFLTHIRTAQPEQAGSKRATLRARLMLGILKHRHLARGVLAHLPSSWVNASKRMVSSMVGSSAPQADSQPLAVGQQQDSPLPLAVYGYFSAESGLGEAVRSEFRALRAAGMPAVARRISTTGIFEDRQEFEFDFDTGEREARIHLLHINADQVATVQGGVGASHESGCPYRIGFWAWELERFPIEWHGAFDFVDEVWTPSRFVAEAVARETHKPVHVFPHPVVAAHRVHSKTAARLQFALPADRVMFLTFCDFNSYIERKNPMAVLRAFEIAAKEAPNLSLLLKCHGASRHDQERRRIMQYARRLEGVFIVDRVLSAWEMNCLFDAADGLISLHRSEGFGLTIAQAMGRGMPVIATDYSGTEDFFDASVGEAVPFELVGVPPGAYPYGKGARWAEPDIAEAAKALVRLAENGALREQLGACARARVQELMSPDLVGREMAARIDQLLDELARKSDELGAEPSELKF